jgi:hypothetical protein
MAEVITIDLTGQTFVKWVVLGMSKERGANDQVQWDCRCASAALRRILAHGAHLQRQRLLVVRGHPRIQPGAKHFRRFLALAKNPL